MMLLNADHGRRSVRVDIRQSLTPREMLAIIGHELRHALEIADAREVRDDQSMIELYRRIGVSRDARSHFETIAARAAGSQVRAELGGGQLRTRNERPPAAGQRPVGRVSRHFERLGEDQRDVQIDAVYRHVRPRQHLADDVRSRHVAEPER